jgi:hypothetical protein
MSERVPVTYCSSCEEPLDAATVADSTHAIPAEGDISICAYCGNISVYRADQTLRPITAREWATMPTETREQLWRARHALDTVRPAPGEPKSHWPCGHEVVNDQDEMCRWCSP